MKAVMIQFGDTEPFLRAQNDLSPATCSKLLGIVSDPAKNACLKAELAAVVDGGECLVKITYKLEGNGPLALYAYELVNTILVSFRVSHFPNVDAIAKELCPGNPVGQQQWVTYALQCLKPGFDYLTQVFSTTLNDAVTVFKAARLFNPQKLQEIRPSAESVDSLSVFPFFDGLTLSNLKTELPLYLAKAIDVAPMVCPLQWWWSNAAELPYWSQAAQKVLLLQPSSAALECVFLY